MRKIIMVAAIALYAVHAAAETNEDGPLPTVRLPVVTVQTVTYSDIIKACGAEWQKRADKTTNKGRDAWQAFRKECVVRKGWKTKRDR